VAKIANPDKTGVNTSATVAKMVKAQDQYMQEVRSKWHLQLTTKKLFKVKVWSPVAGKTLLKFEGAGAAFEKNQLVLRQLIRGKN
jgi:hypothetical protein